MIALFLKLTSTEKRRLCLLFCTGCLSCAVFAYANARLGFLLVQLTGIEQLLDIVAHPWVLSTWVGRVILTFLSGPMSVGSLITGVFSCMQTPQVLFFIITLMYLTQPFKNRTIRNQSAVFLILLLLEILMISLGGFFMFRAYTAQTTMKAMMQIANAGVTLGVGSIIQLMVSLCSVPVTLYQCYLMKEKV